MKRLTAPISLLGLLSVSVAIAAPPTLGPDCGPGATIQGSKNSGKIVLGAPVESTCTLTFSWPKPPSCSAMNETNLSNYGQAAPEGTRTTATTLTIEALSSSVTSWSDGDTISYMCVGQ